MRSASSEKLECPLCSGEGELTRAEILERLGVKDFARVAQLSAEEAFRLLQSKHDREHQLSWSRFEAELTKRTVELREQHKDALRSAQSERDDLTPEHKKFFVIQVTILIRLNGLACYRTGSTRLRNESPRQLRLGDRLLYQCCDRHRGGPEPYLGTSL